MKDRRARLRPKDGARQIYYNQGAFQAGANILSQILPWDSARPFAELAANVPNFIQQGAQLLGGVSQNVGSGTNILSPLAQTDGLVFPYTPTIGFNQSVNYNSYDPVHANQELLAYVRTPAPQITCSGEFSVQNSQEASYALACIHFLRTVSKMSFGQSSSNAGTPPPVLIFSAYGEYMFNDLPVLIQTFDIQYDNSVDYVQVPYSNTFVPAKFTITLVMQVQNTPQTLRQFNLDSFRSGQLMRQGGWI